MALINEGQRSNVSLADARTHLSVASNSPISMADLGSYEHASGTSSADVYTIGSAYHQAQYYLHGRRVANANNASPVAVDAPIVMDYNHGRYKSSNTATPSNVALQQRNSSGGMDAGSNIALGNYVGISDLPITTDQCGQTRGVKGGYSTGVSVYAPDAGGINFTSAHNSSNAVISGKQMVPNMSNADTMGYSVTQTYHNNQWTRIGLNTVAAAGDRVVVIAISQGGTMYTFTGDPIYLRTAGNSSISGTTVETNYGPTKNETGTDTWAAVYSAVVGPGGGAAGVGVNPYHSSTQRYQFHTFVIKGPNNGITGVSTLKYTQAGNTTTNYNSGAGTTSAAYDNKQYWNLSVSGSPFASNGMASSISNSSASTTVSYDVRMQGQNQNNNTNGAWHTTITGGRAGIGNITSGKYSQPGFIGYTPGHGVKPCRQDTHWVLVQGWRG